MTTSDSPFDVRDLERSFVQAPMAGGPSTPQLAAAVSNEGALGFLAAGYLTAERFEQAILDTRGLTAAAFGVNLFVPVASVARTREIEAYRREIRADAERLGVGPGVTRDDDDDYAAKLSVVERTRPSLVTFTFGTPSPDVVQRLRGAGITVGVTVTSVQEATQAVGVGANVLIAQGPEAGGHRGTFDPGADPGTTTLDSLVAELARQTTLPIVAAGGVGSVEDVRRLRTVGATAVQAGTAFLLADEAGTKPTHRMALQDPRFTRTVVTAAFSGRYARGLENQFIRDHQGSAPLGYPEINQLTAPLRTAAAAADDADRLNLWAGVRFSEARPLPAAEIVRALTHNI